MSEATRLRVAAEEALGVPLDAYVAQRRDQGKSWQVIAREIGDATDHEIEINRESLRVWFGAEGGEMATGTADQTVPDEYLPMGQAAMVTGYSPATIRVLFDRGELAGMRDNRGRRFIDPAGIEAFRGSVTIGEAVRLCGLSAQTLRRRFDEGSLAGFRTTTGNRRISRAALAEMNKDRI